MKSLYRRVPVAAPARAQSFTSSFPPPTLGVVENIPEGFKPLGAADLLDNWIPELDGPRSRGGTEKLATVGGDDFVDLWGDESGELLLWGDESGELLLWDDEAAGGSATTLWTYVTGTTSRFFAATQEGVFDISSVADVNVRPTAVEHGRTNGNYTIENFANSSGTYQYLCNDGDAPLLYDGANFTAVTGVSFPPITGVTTSLLNFVWAYKNRLFFIEGGTRKFWYLAIDAISGAATSYELSGVFNLGGNLLFGTTLSIEDAGEGFDDKCVLVSTEGEVAIFEGDDPSDANAWSLVQVLRLPRPISKNAFVRMAGDVLIATEEGVISVRLAIRLDRNQIGENAFSQNIDKTYKDAASRATASDNWLMVPWDSKSLLFVVVVNPADGKPHQFVVNTVTNAWTTITGWNATAASVWEDDYVYGDASGRVYRADTDNGSDDGALFVCKLQLAHDRQGAMSQFKNPRMMWAAFRSNSPINPKYSVATNFEKTFPAAPNALASDVSQWGTFVWGTDPWSGGQTGRLVRKWSVVSGGGHFLAPQIQIAVGSGLAPKAKLLGAKLVYEIGRTVTI